MNPAMGRKCLFPGLEKTCMKRQVQCILEMRLTIPIVSSVIILLFFLFQIFKEYTKKQWDKYPAELNASVLARLPFRLNNDDRYFSDPHQALPNKGYTKMFENMLKSPNIDVVLDADYFKVRISD